MKKRLVMLLCVAALALPLSGCMAHTHIVGNGGTGAPTKQEMQWYAIWGLVPLAKVDSHQMAGNATDYTVNTEITPINFLINIFTQWGTIYSDTVSVTR